MNGVGLDVAAASEKLDFDHNQMVDVLKIVPDAFLGMVRVDAPDDHVAGRALYDLVRDMASEMEVAFSPLDKYPLVVDV